MDVRHYYGITVTLVGCKADDVFAIHTPITELELAFSSVVMDEKM